MKYIYSGKYGKQIATGSGAIVSEFMLNDDDVPHDNKDFKVELFYKKDNPLLKNKIVSKTGNITKNEIEILEYGRDYNFIIKYLGKSVNMLSNDFILFPRCQCDTSNEIFKRPVDNIQQYIKFFNDICVFFESLNYCYLDWKPSNILIDFDNTLKLADFGSCCKRDLKISNPKNINPLFSSSEVMSFHETITPRADDDHIGICYLLLWFLDYKLPWNFLKPKITREEKEARQVLLVIYEMKRYKSVNFIDFRNFSIIPEIYRNAVAKNQVEF